MKLETILRNTQADLKRTLMRKLTYRGYQPVVGPLCSRGCPSVTGGASGHYPLYSCPDDLLLRGWSYPDVPGGHWGR